MLSWYVYIVAAAHHCLMTYTDIGLAVVMAEDTNAMAQAVQPSQYLYHSEIGMAHQRS